jgi:hypothetical protein
MSERASTSMTTVIRELGLVTRREWEELELRLAQVEHRLRLVEGAATPVGPRTLRETGEAPPPDVPAEPGA